MNPPIALLVTCVSENIHVGQLADSVGQDLAYMAVGLPKVLRSSPLMGV